MLPSRDRKGVGAWRSSFSPSRRLDNVHRLVTIPLQLVALILMLISLFGDFRPEGGHARPYAARAQIKAYLTALKTYKEETGDFPTSAQGLQALVQNPGVARLARPLRRQADFKRPVGTRIYLSLPARPRT